MQTQPHNQNTDQKEPKPLPVDLVINNAKVYTAKGIVKAGIAIDNGKITRIAKETNLPPASSKLDLQGQIALPGLIDTHVHLRDEQLAYRETFESGTKAAAAGGITTVIDMPNNRPMTMSTETLKQRMKTAEHHIHVNVAFNSAFPTRTSEVPEIVNTGAIGFKLYLVQQLGGVNIDDDQALSNTLKAISKTQVPTSVHAEDKATIEKNREHLQEQGKTDLEAFLKAHSPEAETTAINRIAKLARNCNARIHICHVSSAAGITAITEARKNGSKITCETTPHHLLLTERDLKKIGKLALEIPPLRKRTDTNALWQALRQGVVDTIGSDHAPHTMEEKEAKSIWDVKPGIVGLETMLPLLLTQMNKGRLTLRQLIRLTCEKPTEIFNIKQRGSLQEGFYADITIVDPKKEHRIDVSKFYSKAKFSPFDGWKTKGKPTKTLVNGQLVMDENQIVGSPKIGSMIKGTR